MFTFFTDPYNEEMLSSVCARYHYYCGNIDNKDTLMELFGKRNRKAFKIFPSRLSYLEKQLNNMKYTSDYFIYKHTIFPFHSPFISKIRQIKTINFMKFEGNSLIYDVLGISPSKINIRHGYMYCHKCVSEDIKNFGEAYFHRVHQLQGVLVCPKHGCSIEEYTDVLKSTYEFTRLDNNKLSYKNIIVYEEQVRKELLVIAKAAAYVLKLPYLAYDIQDVKDRLKILLNKKNYITHGNVVRQRKLLKDFLNYFNPTVLKVLNSEITNSKINWIKNITHSKDIAVAPIRIILLILFLTNNDIKAFFEIKINKEPFGKGPWPCLNVAAEHYLKKVINKCEIKRGYRSTVPKGIFKCTCGYVYFRMGPDKDEQDMYRADKVIKTGAKWESKLKKCLAESNYNISYTSRVMHCSQYKVTNYIKNKGFTQKWKPGEDKKKDNFVEYSEQIINYMNLMPNCTKTDIYLHLQKQISWFRRNNPEWLNKNLPVPRGKKEKTKCKIDYNKLDIDILSRVKSAYDELILLEKPKRITIALIEHYLNLPIKKRINKLPKTKDFLDNIIETVEEFQIRRCKYIIDDKLKNKEDIKLWQVQQKSGIGSSNFKNLKEEIIKYIDMKRSNIVYEKSSN